MECGHDASWMWRRGRKKVRQWLKILIILPLCARLNYQVVVESEKNSFLHDILRHYLLNCLVGMLVSHILNMTMMPAALPAPLLGIQSLTQSSIKQEIKVGRKLVYTVSLPRLCLLNNARRFCSRLSYALEFCCVCTIVLRPGWPRCSLPNFLPLSHFILNLCASHKKMYKE